MIAGTNHFTVVDELIRPGSRMLTEIVSWRASRARGLIAQCLRRGTRRASMIGRWTTGARRRRSAAVISRQRRGQLLGGPFEPGHALHVVADVEQRLAYRVEIDQRHIRLLLQRFPHCGDATSPTPSRA